MNATPAVDAQPPQAGPTDQDIYLPRRLLSIPPRPTQDIIVPYPGGGGSPGRLVTTLALYIDESGFPQRVVIDGPALPPHLENAVKETFFGARFTPGELNGKRVKSLVRIEVVFETAVLPPRPPASAASK